MKKSFKLVTSTFILVVFTSLMYAQSRIVNIEVELSEDYDCHDQLQGEIRGSVFESGVGFLVNDQYIVTAYHLVAQYCTHNGTPIKLKIKITDSEGNRYKVEPKVLRETLFDIAILKLSDKVEGGNSYRLSSEVLSFGDEVKIKGCGTDQYAEVKESNAIIPGVYGSHKLATSVNIAFDVGCSGSPVLHNGKVVGMAISKNDSFDRGYFIQASIIEKAIRGMNDGIGEIQRVFTGTIWEAYNREVVLQGFINEENKALLENYIGRSLIALNDETIGDLSDLRSAFELCTVGKTIRLTFDNGENVNVVGKKRNKIDLVEILNYYDKYYMEDCRNNNRYSFNPNNGDRDFGSYNVVEELKRKYGVNSPLRLYDENNNYHDVTKVILSQFKYGIGVRDVYDLGLVIKTFSPTEECLELRDGGIEIQMPGVLFN